MMIIVVRMAITKTVYLELNDQNPANLYKNSQNILVINELLSYITRKLFSLFRTKRQEANDCYIRRPDYPD